MTELNKYSFNSTKDKLHAEAVFSGRNIAEGDVAHLPLIDAELIMLDRYTLVPGSLEVGCTELVLQRHGEYIRDSQHSKAGSLTEEAIQLETETAANYFSELMEGLSDVELANTYFLFLASDTAYAGKGMRSYETASIAQQVASQLLVERDVPEDNIINNSHNLKSKGSPRPMHQLREPQMFDNSPDFVEFLQSKYGGVGKDFWIAFEEDAEKDVRKGMNAEGPDEIADRMDKTLEIVARYARLFHASNPDSRLVVWADTHYDTISPLIKRDVLHQDKSAAVLVDYGGGAVIDIEKNGTISTSINGKKYCVDATVETRERP